MLYVNFSAEGRFEDGKFTEGSFYPVLKNAKGQKIAFLNGAHDVGLSINRDPQTRNSSVIVVNRREVGDTVFILAQESTVTYVSADHYGRKVGNVELVRPCDSDTLIYVLKPGSWFASADAIYHNEGGVLLRYDPEMVIGWRTWRTLGISFIKNDVECVKSEEVTKIARIAEPDSIPPV